MIVPYREYSFLCVSEKQMSRWYFDLKIWKFVSILRIRRVEDYFRLIKNKLMISTNEKRKTTYWVYKVKLRWIRFLRSSCEKIVLESNFIHHLTVIHKYIFKKLVLLFSRENLLVVLVTFLVSIQFLNRFQLLLQGNYNSYDCNYSSF